MDKLESTEMSAEITINTIIAELSNISSVLSESALYLKYKDSSSAQQEYRESFRSLLTLARDLSDNAISLFDELCKINGNPVA